MSVDVFYSSNKYAIILNPVQKINIKPKIYINFKSSLIYIYYNQKRIIYNIKIKMRMFSINKSMIVIAH
jgi:hypothetical protein